MFRNKEKLFLEACQKNDIQYVNKNIGSIDKEFSDDQGQTPLFACMRNASFDVADILIEIDPDRFQDRDEAKQYLADRGKDNDGAKEKPEEEKEESPLMKALTKPV